MLIRSSRLPTNIRIAAYSVRMDAALDVRAEVVAGNVDSSLTLWRTQYETETPHMQVRCLLGATDQTSQRYSHTVQIHLQPT